MNATSLRIRELQAADRPQWEALWRDYLAFYQTEVPPEIYDTHFDRLLGDDPQDFHALVAEQADGMLVGLAHFLFHRHGWKIENVCYLQDLFAAKSTRGQGVGYALMTAVYAAADAAGAPSVYWTTQEFNAEARRLYDRVGRLTPFIKYDRGV